MRFMLLSVLFAVCAGMFAQDVPSGIVIDDKVYTVDTLIERQIGPGTVYRRLRLPDYPLNVNMLTVDMTDPSVRVETSQAHDRLFAVEPLVDAAARRSHTGHKAIGGANANFWCVTPNYPYSELLLARTFNANVSNGMIITETNCNMDQWDNGPRQNGEFGVGEDGLAYSGHHLWHSVLRSDADSCIIGGVNKVCYDNEAVAYNSYYGCDRPFRTADIVMRDTGKHGFDTVSCAATEVLLRLAPGERWRAGNPMKFIVGEVRDNAGSGILGEYDIAVVGRGDRRNALRALVPGSEVSLSCSWTTLDGKPMAYENMVGGNAQVMVGGELTRFCKDSGYCRTAYSRCGYGASSDHSTMYIVVVDKSVDPEYGPSVGCSSGVMSRIARHYGCSDMTSMDAGGSAQLLVGNRIVNKTTEATPRPVANGMLIFDESPADNEVVRIEFDARRLILASGDKADISVLAYNRYGSLIDIAPGNITLGCDSGAGSVCGNVFTAAAPGQGIITATYKGFVARLPVEVVAGRQ